MLINFKKRKIIFGDNHTILNYTMNYKISSASKSFEIGSLGIIQ